MNRSLTKGMTWRRKRQGMHRRRRRKLPPHLHRTWRGAEALEPRLMLSNVSGHITEDTVWDDANEIYNVTGDLWVDDGATLTLQQGVKVYLNPDCDFTINGSMVINDAEWVKLHDNDRDVSIEVYGNLSVTDTLFQDDYNAHWNKTTELDIHSGATFSASGCTFDVKQVHLREGSIIEIEDGNNILGTRLYCPSTYVPRLTGNMGFDTVRIYGDTLHQDVSWPLLPEMDRYYLDGSFTVADAATLTMEPGTRLYMPRNTTLTINGSMVINDAEWVKLHDNDRDVSI
ncbi:MAG: hypothetical protein R6U98_18805, partial [Pirellulaceae bacterium]